MVFIGSVKARNDGVEEHFLQRSVIVYVVLVIRVVCFFYIN